MTTFECGICADDNVTEENPHDIDGDKICRNCVAGQLGPLFHKALKREGAYPPPWGDVTLNVEDFEYVLGEGFVKKYKAREELYAIPLKRRRYCKNINSSGGECDAFLLPRPNLPPDGANFVCDECGGQSCRDCEEPLTRTKDGSSDHNCAGSVAQVLEDTDLHDLQLQRGKDYQLCPNPECGLKVQLLDGCNHMICKQNGCQTNFCYICGEEADDNSGHWKPGMPCPRYNQPDANNATWDDEDPPDVIDRPYEDYPDVMIMEIPFGHDHYHVRFAFKTACVIKHLPGYLRKVTPELEMPEWAAADHEEAKSLEAFVCVDTLLGSPATREEPLDDPASIEVAAVDGVWAGYRNNQVPDQASRDVLNARVNYMNRDEIAVVGPQYFIYWMLEREEPVFSDYWEWRPF